MEASRKSMTISKDSEVSVEAYLPVLYAKVMQIEHGISLNDAIIADIKLKTSLLATHYFAKREKIINAHRKKLEKNLQELDATISIILDMQDKFSKLG